MSSAKLRPLCALLLGALLLTACTPMAVDYEQISPKERQVAIFSHVTGENSPKHLAATRFAQAASQLTGGHVEIRVYPNSQLYKDQEEVGALKDGAIQFIAVAPSKLAQIDPRWQIFDLPYLFRDFADVERLFASQPLMAMRERLATEGLIPLAIWPNGLKQLTNRRRPLLNPQDFQGLTFRVQAGEVLQDQFAAVGAKVVVSPFSNVYADIEQGTVDGQENTLSNIYTLNLQVLQPYLTISDHGYLPYIVLTQAKWWNALDPSVRQGLQEALSSTTAGIRENAVAMNDLALARLRASGNVQIHTLTPEERNALRAAFQPAYQSLARRLGAPFLDQVIAVVDQPHQ